MSEKKKILELRIEDIQIVPFIFFRFSSSVIELKKVSFVSYLNWKNTISR